MGQATISRVYGCIVFCLGLGRRNAADGPEETMFVAPVDLAQSGHLDGCAWLGALAPDNLGLVESVDRLGPGVVI